MSELAQNYLRLLDLHFRWHLYRCLPRVPVRSPLHGGTYTFAIGNNNPNIPAVEIKTTEFVSTGGLWPRSLYRCLLGALIREARFEHAAEEQFLEMSAEQPDEVECICRCRGWSYEDYMYEALWALHNGNAKLGEEDALDEADWWKKA